MRKGFALVAAALAAAVPGTARGDTEQDITRAKAVAAVVWNHPCGDVVTVALAPPPDPSWRAWTFPSACLVDLSDVRPWRWSELCPALLHEYGHLAGYRDPQNPSDPTHSHDRSNIMWPYEHYDARCDSRGARVLGEPVATRHVRTKSHARKHRPRHRRVHRRVRRRH